MNWKQSSNRSGFAGGAIKVKRTDIPAELEVIEYSPRSARLALPGDAPPGRLPVSYCHIGP